MLYENRETSDILTESDMVKQFDHWKKLSSFDSYDDFISSVTDTNGLYIAYDIDEDANFQYYEDKKTYAIDRIIKDYYHALQITDFMNFGHFIEYITECKIYVRV